MLKLILYNIQPKLRTFLIENNKSGLYNAYSTKCTKIGTVDYSCIKKIAELSEKLLIDVRTQEEIEKTGRIPGSINIALDILDKKLGPSTNKSEFRSQFGRAKPTTTTQLIFTCRSGKRAQESAEKAVALGYINVWVYEGSWIDWQKRTKALNCHGNK